MIAGYPVPLLLLAAGVATIGLVLLDRVARRPDLAVVAVVLSYGVLDVVVDLQASLIGVNPPITTGQVVVGRLSTLLLLIALPLVLLRARGQRAGVALWAAAVAWTVTGYVAGFVAGGRVYSQDLIVWVLVFTALLLSPRLDPKDVAHYAKLALGFAIVASVALVLLGAPGSWRHEGAALPGVGFRLQGVFRHPNALGPAMLLYLVLERVVPSRGIVRATGMTTALVLLVLSQSKTAWASAAVVYALFWYHDHLRGRLAVRAFPLVVLLAAMLLGMGYLAVSEPPEEQELVFEERGFDEVRTLTGRTVIWAAGVDAWREAPLFGEHRFFVDYAQRTDQPWAGQAHNQAVSALVERGLVGLVGLVAYAGALAVHGWRHRTSSRFTSLALVAVIALRSMTETPLDRLDLMHVVVFAMLLGWERESEPDPAPESSQPDPDRGAALLPHVGARRAW